MTNEKAATWLAAIKAKYIHGGDEAFDEQRREALDMAIKALLSELGQTCEGCKHQGKWEFEIYYGAYSPCTGCKRIASDRYER